MRACLLDLRCLQDGRYRDRGIGRLTRTMLTFARVGLPGVRLVGLIDPELGPLPDADRTTVDAVRTNAYTGAMTEPCGFVQFSPMTHDPLFVARLLNHRAIPSAAVVYDFIPVEQPARYLAAPGASLDYHVALRWLARHELFLPISRDVAAGLEARLGVPAARMAVTGAPLGPDFDAVVPRTAQHVLVVAGPDARQNPDVVVRAHASSTALQSARMPLVITGRYAPGWLEEQRNAAARHGGDPRLIEAAGHVTDAALVQLYAAALCVVVPSTHAGFSLPMVEAMASGVPVLASDIAVHRELVQDGLFQADDAAGLGRLLDCAMGGDWRTSTLARQARVWPRYRGATVAARFWAAVRRLRPTVAPTKPHGRARVALLTPLPPDRSGVADYSAASVAALARRADLHILTPTAAPVRPVGAVSIGRLTRQALLLGRFDRVVAVLGNSVSHLEILKLLLRHGGAAILHDGRMLDLYAQNLGIDRTVRLAEQELGRKLGPNEIWEWLAGNRPPAAMFLGEIAAVAEPLAMHSGAAVEEVTRRHGREAAHLPFALHRCMAASELSSAARAAARARLGIPTGELLVATFGYVQPKKAPTDCIWALALLRSWGVAARLHFVGAPFMDTGELRALIGQLGLRAWVELPEMFVPEAVYRDHLAAADVGVQLRAGDLGAVSGALADCIGAGLPTVASATLARALSAPAFVRSVPDAPSPVLLAEAVVALPGRGTTEAARLAYASGHGFERYAEALMAALDLA